jgi:hypothetical protein
VVIKVRDTLELVRRAQIATVMEAVEDKVILLPVEVMAMLPAGEVVGMLHMGKMESATVAPRVGKEDPQLVIIPFLRCT